MKQTKVLFVCMGNICRSPTAEGVFRKYIADKGSDEKFLVDSAGTHAYHVGEPADSRAQQTAKNRGVDLSQIRARKVSADDFEFFDHVLAMDTDNYDMLLAISAKEHHHKIKLFLDFAPNSSEQNVPDPYYGGANGFEHVFDLVEDASKGFFHFVMNGIK